ncbi:MAG: anti-sigma factor [Bacteroidia bacterium]|nr:anti-sigma factor [Bacteroidia bacterium]
MDLKEYISSGVVELYAMGGLQPSEKREFEQRLLLYPELAEELEKVREGLEVFTGAYSKNPRPALREMILGKSNTAGGKGDDPGKLLQVERSHTLTYKYLIAASLAALVISTFASWFFYSRWDEAEDRYVTLFNEKNQLAQNYNLVKNSFDKTYADMMLMRDENVIITQLNSTDTTHHYQARVYWNRNTGETYIDILDLPEPDQGLQYQLWAVTDGTMTDAGVFTPVPEMGMQRVKNVQQPSAWAVTLEPTGGSQVPTMEHLMLHS